MDTNPVLTTDMISLAARFVNRTANHIFLTGKAGTGKTTFLHNLAKATHKKYVIVAPTGIAALNAGGVTIHSQFLLPFGSFLPADIPGNADYGDFYTSQDLARRNPLNSARKQVLRDIDLLIIDEVSMLRADLLDAIDYRMKAAKGNFRKSFGGVQLLMIGDLFQLPPIVKDREWARLKTFYKSPHFFESVGLKQNGFTYIELDKIFRQQDNAFISILNNLRNNRCTVQDIAKLNEHYTSEIPKTEDVITLTTHNRQADDINLRALKELPGKTHSYKAEIKGEFPENIFPLPEQLDLKVGAQVMFVKNDSPQNRYYNGKLARISKLSDEGITVSMTDENRELTIEKVSWENKKYSLNSTTKELQEDIAGTFSQFPIKLAWAITVHKSQGLTFDKAVIDVGQAFAPGQVYVALSRLRSLDGLILRTKINTSAISCDQEVLEFSGTNENQGLLETKLQAGQNEYLSETLRQTFDFESIIKQIDHTEQKGGGNTVFSDADMQNALPDLRQKIQKERDNTIKFQNQIAAMLSSGDFDTLKERIEKGSDYYLGFLHECLFDLLVHMGEVGMLTRTKTYVNALEEIDQMLSRKISDLQKAAHLAQCILENKEIEVIKEFENKRKAKRDVLLSRVENHLKANPKNLKTATGKKRKKAGTRKGDKIVGETYLKTYALVKEGMDVAAIAKMREMAESTIEGHIARGIVERQIEVEKVLDTETSSTLHKVFEKNPDMGLNDLFKELKGAYSYGKLRIMQAAMELEREKEKVEE